MKEWIIKSLNIISYVVLNGLTQILNKNSETHLPLCKKNSPSGPTQSVNCTMKCTYRGPVASVIHNLVLLCEIDRLI